MMPMPGPQLNTFDPPERDSLFATEQSLTAMKERLDAILEMTTLTEEALVEITAILNNVSYVFLYLEANNDQVSYRSLLPFRDAFYRDDALDARILAKLYQLKCREPGTEQARQAYIRQLENKQNVPDPYHHARMAHLRAEVGAAEARLATAQAAFVERLVPGSTGRAPAAYYRMTARVQKPELRTKLSRAWNGVTEKEADIRADIVDKMIDQRHQDAARRRGQSPLSETLEKCCLTEDEISGFLASYLENALTAQTVLEKTLISAYGTSEPPLSHFSHFMLAHFRHKEVPLFDLDQCLDYAFQMASAVFGLDFSARIAPGQAVIVAEASSRDGPVGRINFDLWQQNGRDRGANHTLGLRNKADWKNVIQRPEAYVSCRFALAPDGSRRITFQNVHSLLHEFGHAINHLLMKEHLPNQSGLEYLPLERLECLSMWSEKWVYHPSFAEALDLTHEQRLDLSLCQDAKKIEYLSTFAERALIAFLDFECHRQPGKPLRAVYDRLDAEHGISRFVHFGDIPQYFSWPMFIANPGANFSYLFGAAWSVEAYLPFAESPLGQDISKTTEDCFAPCFSVQMPSACPNSACLPEFYLSGLYGRQQILAECDTETPMHAAGGAR